MKDIFRISSLKRSVVLSIVLIIAACAFVSAIIINFIIAYQMSQKYAAEKEAVIESLSTSIKPVLDTGDYKQLEQIITPVLVFENVFSVSVYDPNGDLIISLSDSPEEKDVELDNFSIFATDEKLGSFEIAFTSKSADDFTRITTLIIIVALVAFLILSGLALYLFLGRSVIRPIEYVTKTIETIGPDNLSTRLELNTNNEIGKMAASFNRMADNLESSQMTLREARDNLEMRVEERTKGERRRSEQLRIINEVGRQISSILSLEELLPYVVNTIQQTFRFYSVNIFINEPDSKELSLRASAGYYDEKDPSGYSLSYNEGIVGVAAAGREPVNVSDVTKDTRYRPFEKLPDTRSELAVPIKMGVETLGVLDIQSNESDAFDEIDVFTLSILSDQLGVVIENTRLYRETQELTIIEERNRMAREIHDTLAQGFTGIILQLEAAEQALDEDTSSIQAHLNRARNLAKESLNEARRSVRALRPETLEEQTLLTTLQQYLDLLSQDTDIVVDFSASGNPNRLSAPVEDALLRISQEAITNVRKHAQAHHVEINLNIEATLVTLIITDDGRGFDPEIQVHDRYGLIGIRERVQLLNGTFIINSKPSNGTKLIITVPLDGGNE